VFAEAVAAPEGLNGWVQNLPDGRVEVAVEGEAESVERFERHIAHGPPGARVRDLQIDETVPTRRETGFSIR
jgi:acylphosphatase